MKHKISHTFKIIGDRMYPMARQGGLSRVGHLDADIDGIIVVRHENHRYVLVFGPNPKNTEIFSLVKQAIPDIEQVANAKGSMAYKDHKENGAEGQLYFDRDTYV